MPIQALKLNLICLIVEVFTCTIRACQDMQLIQSINQSINQSITCCILGTQQGVIQTMSKQNFPKRVHLGPSLLCLRPR